MDPNIRMLLDQARSSRGSIRQEAILRLAEVLELNSMPRDSRRINRSEYAWTLPEVLLDLELSGQERLELAHELFDLGRSRPLNPTILWAMGKAGVREAFELILDLAHLPGSDLDEESAYQAAVALENYTLRAGFFLRENEKEKLLNFLELAGQLSSARVEKVLDRIRHALEQ